MSCEGIHIKFFTFEHLFILFDEDLRDRGDKNVSELQENNKNRSDFLQKKFFDFQKKKNCFTRAKYVLTTRFEKYLINQSLAIFAWHL